MIKPEKLSNQEFMKLPREERRRILTKQASDPKIIAYYKELAEGKDG